MASLHDYGSLLLASRLRKVSEALYAGVDELYRGHGVELPSRCFPILFMLRDHGRLGISELAVRLGQSHPAVSQMSRKLLEHGVVREWPDPADDRRRLLSLSRRGASLMKRLEPVWQAIVAAVGELEASHPVSTALTGIDRSLEARSFAERIGARLEAGVPIEIVAYERRYARDFKRLNLEWLEKYFRVEAIDEVVLSNPDAILRSGGAIFLVRRQGEIIGTCALLHKGKRRFELSKMAVTERYQGLGIGRRLINSVVDAFNAGGGGELFLETNSKLAPAIALYESIGFVHSSCAGPSEYERCNVHMTYRGPPGLAGTPASNDAACQSRIGAAPQAARREAG